MAKEMPQKASAIIIGNEILTGKIQDTNSKVLAQTLFDCGIRLELIETIPDQIDRIVKTVRHHASRHDLVFTSGGIGPTHDDVTYEGVSKAFGQQLRLHTETHQKYMAFYGSEPNEARRKMMLLPEKAKVFWVPELWVPIVFIKPVYVLPGIPQLFEAALRSIQPRFQGKAFSRALVHSQKAEGDLATELDAVQKQYAELEIGSYPQPIGASCKTLISIEGKDEKRVKTAQQIIEGFI